MGQPGRHRPTLAAVRLVPPASGTPEGTSPDASLRGIPTPYHAAATRGIAAARAALEGAVDAPEDRERPGDWHRER